MQKMEFVVESLKLFGYSIETPGQEVYQFYACPICAREDKLQNLAVIEANGKTSLESVFCTRCQHRYHRKFPDGAWLEQYYKAEFEMTNSDRVGVCFDKLQKPSLRQRLRRRLGGLVRYGLHGKPDRVHDFGLGVTKEYGGYWLRNARIKKVLEVGCGYGESLMIFKELGYEAFGTDANPRRVAACRERGLNVHLTGLDSIDEIEHFGPFDFIYSKHVIEHVLHVRNHVSSLSKLLSKGGFIYIETPELSAEIFHHHSSQIQHIHAFSVASLCNLLSNYGVVPVRLCVDNNIQILAYKGDVEANPVASFAETYVRYPEHFVEYLRIVKEGGNARVRLTWDHYWIRIERLEDGTVLYQGSRGPWQVKRLPYQHEMIISSEDGSGSEEIFPISFRYEEASNPPLWCKR